MFASTTDGKMTYQLLYMYVVFYFCPGSCISGLSSFGAPHVWCSVAADRKKHFSWGQMTTRCRVSFIQLLREAAAQNGAARPVVLIFGLQQY